MNRNATFLAVLLFLMTIGSSCINESVLVSVNLNPIISRYKLGTGTSFLGTLTIKLDSIVSNQYKNKIKQGRVYNLKVKVEGEYAGEVTGVAAIRVGNGDLIQILRFPESGSAPWSALYTTQSLLNNSPYLSPQSAGISELLTALTTVPLPSITIATLGTLSIAPVPNNLYVTLEVYLQADAELN